MFMIGCTKFGEKSGKEPKERLEIQRRVLKVDFEAKSNDSIGRLISVVDGDTFDFFNVEVSSIDALGNIF